MPAQRKILGSGKFLRLIDEGGWEYTERVGASGVVVIVPLTAVGELVLVEQFRHPLNARVLELPAGLVGDKAEFEGEAFESAALRELEEETGFLASKLEFLTSGPSAAGSSNTLIHFYLATGLKKTGPGGGDEHEDIQVHVVPMNEFEAFSKAREKEGCLLDAKIFTGLYFAQARFK
jgi:ADP-ribose pyrophosphatase